MSQAKPLEETRANEDLFRLISHALVLLMMTCASLTFSHLVHYFFSDWKPGLVAAIAFFVAFERLYTWPRFKRLSTYTTEWFTNLLAHWIVMLFAIRLVIGLSHGLAAFQVELYMLTRQFAGYFFSPEFMIALVISVLVWFLTGYIAELLDEMGYDRAVIAREVMAIDPRYVPPRARLMSLIFSLGSTLIIFTAMVRINVRELLAVSTTPITTPLGALAGGGGSTLLYFMFGLALISQAHFISLHTNWRIQEIQVQRGLVKNWAPYSLLFLALLAGVVSLLPTHYSLGLLEALNYVIQAILSALYFTSQFLLSVLMFLLGLPFMLFGGTPPQIDLPPPPEPPDPPAAELASGGPFPWWTLIRSILSWALLLGLLGFSLVHFLRQHTEFAQTLIRLPGGRWLVRIWNWLVSLFGGIGRGVSSVVLAGLRRLREARAPQVPGSAGGFLSLRRLNARQRVYYFYLALIRRGGERGLRRAPSQTPYEYASAIEPVLPDVDQEVESLTGSFMEARYSRHEVPPEKASQVRRTWERIRQSLRNLKKS